MYVLNNYKVKKQPLNLLSQTVKHDFDFNFNDLIMLLHCYRTYKPFFIGSEMTCDEKYA